MILQFHDCGGCNITVVRWLQSLLFFLKADFCELWLYWWF